MEAILSLDSFPLLAGLPRITLAKLLPDVQTIELAAGSEIGDGGNSEVFLIREGTVVALGLKDEEAIPIGTLTTGDLFPHPEPSGTYNCRQMYRAGTDVVLYRLPADRLEQLAISHPQVLRRLHLMTASHLARMRYELICTRRTLATYAEELWQSVQGELMPADNDIAAAAGETSIPEQRPKQHGHGKEAPVGIDGLWDKRAWGPLLALTAAMGWLLLQPGEPDSIRISLAILIWAGVNWLFSTLPDHVVALSAALAMVMFGLGNMREGFAGFVTPAWWLLVGVMGIVVAVARTGLLYRLALTMLKRLPPTYLGQSTALALIGLLATPALPSAAARIQMAVPLSWELAQSMGFNARSKGSAGLAMACYLGFSQMYFLFLNGTTLCLLMWGLLPAAEKLSVTWGSWVLAALPMAAVLFVGFMGLLFILYRPGPGRKLSQDLIQAQLGILGPMGKAEKITAWVTILLLAAFITEPLHGFSPVWAALMGFAALAALGVLDRQTMGQMDWNFALFMGAVISLGVVAEQLGTDQVIGNLIAPLFGPVFHSPALFLLLTAALVIALRMVIPPPLTTVVMMMTLSPVVHLAGISPFVVGLVIVAFCGSVWLIPAQWSVYVTAYSATDGQAFSHRQVHLLAWANLLLLALGVLISVPYWRWLGLIQ